MYCSRVKQIFLLAPFTESTTMWVSLSVPSLCSDIVGINTGEKFPSLPKFSAALNRWIFNPTRTDGNFRLRQFWPYNLSGLSTLYCSRLTQFFLSALSTRSTNLWVSLSCPSMSSDVVDINTGEKVLSLPKFFAAFNRWFLIPTKFWKSALPLGKVCCHLFENNEFYIQDFKNSFGSKIVRDCPNNDQSPHYRLKLVVPKKQCCRKSWILVVRREGC